MTEQLDQLFSAFAKFQAECPDITHDAVVKVRTKKGGQYEFSYATLGNIQRTTKPYLTKHGLSVIQLVSNGGVETILAHESGQFIESGTFVIEVPTEEDEVPNPQDVGGAVTYAKRYQLAAMLNVDAMKDDDANSASGNEIVAEKSSTPPPEPVKKPKKKAPVKKAKPEPEPVEEGDDDAFIDSVESKTDLIKWWQEKISGEQEEHYRANYMAKVMSKLKELS